MSILVSTYDALPEPVVAVLGLEARLPWVPLDFDWDVFDEVAPQGFVATLGRTADGGVTSQLRVGDDALVDVAVQAADGTERLVLPIREVPMATNAKTVEAITIYGDPGVYSAALWVHGSDACQIIDVRGAAVAISHPDVLYALMSSAHNAEQRRAARRSRELNREQPGTAARLAPSRAFAYLASDPSDGGPPPLAWHVWRDGQLVATSPLSKIGPYLSAPRAKRLSRAITAGYEQDVTFRARGNGPSVGTFTTGLPTDLRDSTGIADPTGVLATILADLGHALVTQGPSVANILFGHLPRYEVARALMSGLRSVGLTDRQALFLALDIGGYRSEEIAELVGDVKASTVRSHIGRAREKLAAARENLAKA